MDRSRLLRALASRRLRQPNGSRSIASAAEALSFHPASQPQASTSAGPAGESQTSKAERTLKKFWKDVKLVQDGKDGSWSVLLDKRTLKTPGLKKLVLPKEKMAAAMAVAYEWDSQENLLKPHSLPVTSLASRALEGLSDPPTRMAVIEMLTRYLHTDTVCFEENKSAALVKLQSRHWTPLVKWVEETYGVSIKIAGDGQLFHKQPDETVLVMQRIIGQYDVFQLAAFERAVMASKSFLIGLGLVEGRLDAESAALAAHVEVQSQIDRWGEVEDTHDVDHQDIRVRLGSVALLLGPSSAAGSNR